MADNSTGEMSFLDHLEELRKRILFAVAAVAVGVGVGWLITVHYRMPERVQAPIAPYVPGGRLIVLNPIDPFMIYLKFALVLGLVLASPWVLYQLWLFLAPALTPREKKAILPALFAGMILFLAGAAIGWFVVLEPTVRWLLTFKQGSFIPQITYESYLDLVLHLLIAMGVAAELPLVMILLSSLGVVSSRAYSRFRRLAIFLSFIGGAILSPTPEVVSMVLFTIPLILLYEIGVAGAYLVERRRAKAARALAAGAVVFCCLIPRHLHAQVPVIPPPPGIPTLPGQQPARPGVAGAGVRTIDSATAKRLGIPAGPSRKFPAADSVMQDLLDRPGFAATRFIGDSATFVVDSQRILLGGHAATLRDASQFEANQIVYNDLTCMVEGSGEPRMFQPGHSALIGITMRFNTCQERGVIGEAYTAVQDRGTNWFVRGNLAVDSSGKRLYAAHSSFTSCDLPDPHYHFIAGQVKWESSSMLTARPAVLYVRDVPVAWIPFMFQDTKQGRASGILIPRFGFNDIVRPTRTYNRSITNMGYYWAPNDYVDLTGHFDWYSNRYIAYGADFNYRWLDRFVQGGLHLNRQIQDDGATNQTLSWQHQQSFNINTSLNFNLNYSSNSQVLQNNSIDPLLSTQNITSQLNLTRRFRGGSISLGGSRSQQLSDGSVQMSLTTALNPKPIALTRRITWSPSVNATDNVLSSTPNAPFEVFTVGGLDTMRATSHSHEAVVTLNTPFDLFGLTWQNGIRYTDQQLTGRQATAQRVPDLSTANPDDSIDINIVRNGNFQSGLDFTTGINLPLLLRSSWKVTPTVGIANITSGPLLLRSPGSNGKWVSQGVKPALGLSSAPTFFGFINRAIGPYQRFRYTLAPLLGLQYSPAASVSKEYAAALGTFTGQNIADIPSRLAASVLLHQTFEGKVKRAATDTNTDPAHLATLPKRQLLSISTSQLSYDFKQASLPHRTGWQERALTNSFQSDLVQGFTLSTTHDLWRGDVGTDTAVFSPFLSSLQASLSLSGRTVHSLAALLGLARRDSVTTNTPAMGTTSPLVAASSMSMIRPGMAPQLGIPRRGFSMTLSYSLQRTRPFSTPVQPVTTEPTPIGTFGDPLGTQAFLPVTTPTALSSLGISMSFSPTTFWSVTWNTQYDISTGTFESQNIQLQRDLHDWRATFSFVKSPTGNFALYFSVFLMSLPDIKFDYNQTTLQQRPLQP